MAFFNNNNNNNTSNRNSSEQNGDNNHPSQGEDSSLRWWITALISLGLSLGTWNPTEYHFIHYITQAEILSGFTPFAILLMVGVWFLAIKSIFQSLGMFGAFFIVITILTFIWGLNQYGLIDLNNLTQLGWVATFGMAFIIWAGLNASKAWKRVTGVYSTDRIDDDI